MNYKSIIFCHTVLNAPQSTSTRQWPMAAWLWLSMMSILKCRDLRGLNATGALVSLTFPTATAQPSSYSPLLHLLSFALYPHQLLPPETNSEADTRKGKEPQVIAFLCWDSRSNPLRAGRPGALPPPGSGALAPSTPALALPSLGGGHGVKIRPAWDCLLLLLSVRTPRLNR